MFVKLVLAAAMVLALVVQPVTYRTYLRPRFEAFGYAGTLVLRFLGHGNIQGTYTEDSGGSAQAVSGGSSGTHIWLDLPTLGRLHVEGTIARNGDITGLATPLHGSTVYVLTATRVAKSSEH